MFDIRNSFQFVLSTCIILSWLACLPVPSQKMKFTKSDSCWVLNCALINLRFMRLVQPLMILRDEQGMIHTKD